MTTTDAIAAGDFARISPMHPSRYRGRTALVLDVEGDTATVRVSTVRTFVVGTEDLKRVVRGAR